MTKPEPVTDDTTEIKEEIKAEPVEPAPVTDATVNNMSSATA